MCRRDLTAASALSVSLRHLLASASPYNSLSRSDRSREVKSLFKMSKRGCFSLSCTIGSLCISSVKQCRGDIRSAVDRSSSNRSSECMLVKSK